MLEFGTSWCGHCRAAQPHIQEAFTLSPEIPHRKIEDGKGQRLGRASQVKLWPTLIFLRDGQEVERLVRPTDIASIARAMARINQSLAEKIHCSTGRTATESGVVQLGAGLLLTHRIHSTVGNKPLTGRMLRHR